MAHQGTSFIGERIQVTGHSCAGKSSLAAQLAEELCIRYVELDALHWLPNWVGLSVENPELFRRRIHAATNGDTWVVAGSYTVFCQEIFWPRLQTLIWLDLPKWQLLLRLCKRSWQRSRSKQLLWGSNYERFWHQFKIWNKEDSLIWWIWTQHERKRREMLVISEDPQWAHIRIIRLTSAKEVATFRRDLARCDQGIAGREFIS